MRPGWWEVSMKRILSGALASVLALAASAALAQSKPPLKLGGILDMSGLYADITGPGSETAAKMAAEDFGGEVLAARSRSSRRTISQGRSCRHHRPRHVRQPGRRDVYDVAASATALAAGEIAKARNKIIMFSGPGSIRLSNEACGPTPCITCSIPSRRPMSPVSPRSKRVGHLVLPDRRLRVRAGPRKRHHQCRAEVRRQGAGQRAASLNTSDFSSFLLQAQASKAKVIGLANAGGDHHQRDQAGGEFGIMKGGQKISPLLAFVTDIDSVGLETAQGLLLAEAFYWDLNDDTRAFSKRFMERTKRVPTSAQAGVYSSVTHYLKAVKAAGTTDSAAVMKIMKDTPINDMFAKNGRIREDGRMVHDMYLFEVKKPSESKGAGTTTSYWRRFPAMKRSSRWSCRAVRW